MGKDKAAPWPLPIQMILSPAEQAAIGCLAVEVTRLEDYCEELICDLCRLTPIRAEVFVGRMMITAKVEALFSILEPYAKSKKRKDDIKKLLVRIKTLVSDRNTVVHGKWDFKVAVLPKLKITRAAFRKQMIVNAERVMSLAFESRTCLTELGILYTSIAPMKRRASKGKSAQLSAKKSWT